MAKFNHHTTGALNSGCITGADLHDVFRNISKYIERLDSIGDYKTLSTMLTPSHKLHFEN